PVCHALGVFQRLSEHHVAAAFAVNGMSSGKARQSGAEVLGGSKTTGMELGISAGKPADVASLRRRLVRKRGERDQFGALSPPVATEVRVEEGEGGIPGQSDALTGRCEGQFRRAG